MSDQLKEKISENEGLREELLSVIAEQWRMTDEGELGNKEEGS